MEMGLGIRAELFYKYYVGLGFTEASGVDIPGDSAASSLLYHDVNELTDVSLATSAIGQTFKVTPLQVVTAMCAMANGGYLLQPYIVSKVLDSQGNVLSQTDTTVRRQAISRQTSERISALLAEAVNGGGSKNAYVAGYRIAGKTGTGEKTDQVVEEEQDKDVWASFAGFAPADNPQVAILVMVDTPTVGQYGGTICAPVARKIFEEILPYLGIEPEYTEQEIARMNTVAPKVGGYAVVDAQRIITNKNLKVSVQGKGSTVLQQVPAAGTEIAKNGTVVLYTDDASLQKTVTVPDLIGRSLAQVNSRVAGLDLNVIAKGITTGQGQALAAAQSIPAGTEVLRGTVITVEFIYQDTTA
jgi:stage V sporulation protein D (sporulation-specific penicillin-binding protein)